MMMLTVWKFLVLAAATFFACTAEASFLGVSSEEDGSCGLRYTDVEVDLSNPLNPQVPQQIPNNCACVVEDSDDEDGIETDEDFFAESSDDDDDKVLNCGSCGQCSNCHDIQIYAESSKDTSGNILTQLFDFPCAITYYFTKQAILAETGDVAGATAAGRQAASDCIAANTALLDLAAGGAGVGFTPDCLDCWADASQCTTEQCIDYDASFQPVGGPCKPLLDVITNVITSVIAGGGTFEDALASLAALFSGGIPTELQVPFLECLVCDALVCAPPFVECAGASRGSIGLPSQALAQVTALLGQSTCIRAAEDNVCNV